MNEFNRIFRLWNILTAAFMLMAVSLVAIFFAYRTYQFEVDAREAHRHLLESQIHSQYTKLVEEAYLHLDSTLARQSTFQQLLGGKGRVLISIAPRPNSSVAATNLGAPDGAWEISKSFNEDVYSIPLFFGDLYVADLQADIKWAGILSAKEGKNILLGLLGLFALICAASFSSFILLRKKVFSPLFREILTLQQTAAVAKMVQMLAHDVRKPFSILNMGLGMLQKVTQDPEKVKNVLGKLVPEINKAIASVDGMVADVLEIGSASTQLMQEPAAPELLIENVLGDIFRVYPKSHIAISYEFKHKSMVNVHIQKVARVFSNIFGNAAQAMNYKGDVWFKTGEHDGLVEFTIGNAGSYISPESLARLFEAFFTSGKKGGTGLGLAIAEKVVNAHGGKIWCVSEKNAQHPDGFVEFHFTLPTAGQLSNFKGKLPAHSSDITKAILAMTEARSSASCAKSEDEIKFEAEVASANTKLGRPLKILLVDDESIYRAGIVSMLTHAPELAAAVKIEEASTSDEAIALCREHDFDLLVTDVDLGAGSPIDGFELVEALRAGLNNKCLNDALICVLSNRIVPSDYKTAIAQGADAFISKPIGQVPLLKLLLQTFRSVRMVEKPVDIAPKVEVPQALPRLAVVEDNIFMLEAFVDALSADSEVFGFSSPECLIEKLNADPDFLNSLACVVTDFHFDNSTAYDGVDVGKLVKSRRPGLSVLLSSDGETKNMDLVGSIDHVIAKAPTNFSALAKQYSLEWA